MSERISIVDAEGTEVAHGFPDVATAQELADAWNASRAVRRWVKPYRAKEEPMEDEKREFYAEVDKLAAQCHALAGEFNAHPHYVADCVAKAVTLPFRPYRKLADSLVNATTEDEMLEAENEILDRLDVSPGETELGLTRSAVELIERFVSEQTGSEWTYAKLPPGIVEPDETVRSIFR